MVMITVETMVAVAVAVNVGFYADGCVKTSHKKGI